MIPCQTLNSELQVLIPTFDRARQLDRMLDSLLSNFKQEGIFFPVHVQINPGISSNDYNPVLCKYRDFVTFSINKFNIGANINILNCIAASSSAYCIVLGDDDIICPGFASLVAKAFSILNSNSTLSSVKILDNQSPPVCDQIAFSLNDILSIIPEASRLGRIGSLIHISSWIFKTSLIKPLLSYAYRLSSTCFAHVIPSLLLLADESMGIYFLSVSTPLLWPQDNTQSWDPGPVYASLILGLSNCFGYVPDNLASFLFYGLIGGLSLRRVLSVFLLSFRNNTPSRAALVLFSLVSANIIRLPLLLLLLVPSDAFRLILNISYNRISSVDRI